MCVILIDKERTLTYDDFELAHMSNSDGIGLAWPCKTGVQWVKGLATPEEAWDVVQKEVPKTASPLIVHFRMATAGGESLELTHPFPITPKAGTALRGVAKRVLFHNGHWHDWDILRDVFETSGALPVGEMSDSRIAAIATALYGECFLDKFAKKYGRFALLSPEGFSTWGDFCAPEKGVIASNTSWKTWSGYGRYYEGYDWHKGGRWTGEAWGTVSTVQTKTPRERMLALCADLMFTYEDHMAKEPSWQCDLCDMPVKDTQERALWALREEDSKGNDNGTTLLCEDCRLEHFDDKDLFDSIGYPYALVHKEFLYTAEYHNRKPSGKGAGYGPFFGDVKDLLKELTLRDENVRKALKKVPDLLTPEQFKQASLFLDYIRSGGVR